MRVKKSFPLAAAIAVVFAPVLNAATTVVYAETFSKTTPANELMSGYGWNAYKAGGVAVISSTDAFVANVTGKPTDLADAGQPGDRDEATGAAVVASSSGTAFFAFTTEYYDHPGTIALTRSNLDTISLYTVNTAESIYRVALQIGGNWYASASMGTAALGGANEFPTKSNQLSLNDFTSSDWTAINFTAGSVLSLGTSGLALPDGTITAFGTYIGRPTATVSRFDSFVVSIPEPSGAMLLGASGFLILLRRRR